jgi:hypothetical protein
MNRFQSMIAALVFASSVGINAQAELTGKWQGTTASGRPVVLDVRVKGQEMTGKLTLGPQSTDISEGKVQEKAFSFRATMDGRTITLNGRLVGDDVELTVEGVANPVATENAVRVATIDVRVVPGYARCR